MELSPEQQAQIQQQKDNCPFCQMVAGKIPVSKVYEDDRVMCVLDINPAKPGHLLVMPKEHYPIMPLMPKEEFIYLFARIRQISKHLRDAMVASNTSIFIANGGAAGQQSMHFLVHIIPSDSTPSHFQIPSKQLEQDKVQQASQMLANNMPIMMKERTPLFPLGGEAPAEGEPPKNDLATFIEQNPELKKLLMENPDAVIAGIEENPTLKPLFEGVDIHALSQQLNQLQDSKPKVEAEIVREPERGTRNIESNFTPSAPTEEDVVSDTPRAVDLSDEQLIAFLNSKEKLKELLVKDIKSLKDAIPGQPKLVRFFESSSPEEVLARIDTQPNLAEQASVEQLHPTSTQPRRRFGS